MQPKTLAQVMSQNSAIAAAAMPSIQSMSLSKSRNIPVWKSVSGQGEKCCKKEKRRRKKSVKMCRKMSRGAVLRTN